MGDVCSSLGRKGACLYTCWHFMPTITHLLANIVRNVVAISIPIPFYYDHTFLLYYDTATLVSSPNTH